MNNINQYYEILNVDSSASLETVKAAYRSLAKIWHPDLCINNPKLKAQAEIEIKRINQAYTAIKSYLEFKPDLSSKIDASNQPQVSIKKNISYSGNRNKVQNHVNYKKTKKAQIIRCLISISALQKSITSIVISSDDKTFASIGKNNKIKLWNINTGKKIAVLKGHSGIINSIVIDTRGRFLVSAGRDETIRLWNLKTHKTIKAFRGYLSNPGETTSLFLKPDNKTLLTFNTDSTIQAWDINQDKIVKTITLSGYFDRLDVAKNCKTFCTTHLTFPLQIRNIENGKVIRSINNDSDIICTAFSPDGSQLATGGFDRLIMLWDINTGNKIHTLSGHSGRVSSIAFSCDGENIISGDWDGTIKVWQLKTGKEIMSIKAHFSKIKTISITYNNKTLITGDERGEMKIWRCFF